MAELLKDVYKQAYFDAYIQKFKAAYPAFDDTIFLKLVYQNDWKALSIKARMQRINESLHQTLDLPFPQVAEILKKAAPVGNGLADMVFPDYVGTYGLDHPEIALDTLEYLTEFSSSEFAIRPFILKYESISMQRMLAWAQHENHHIRRLASEGCRWRLPWAMSLPKFKADPSHTLPILEILKADETKYVQKSVANHLNDISHNFPDLVLDTIERWQKDNNPYTNWIVKHAARTMLKAGNTRAMRLFGFGDPAAIEIIDLAVAKKEIAIGDHLHFSFVLKNNAAASLLRVEYAIDYVKKSGKTSRKVFSITENTYPSGTTNFQRKQSFKNMTTRKHYAGTHHLTILINGVEKIGVAFDVR